MEDAEFFLPSEIARLVYGHLKTTETSDVPNKFLIESPQLEECREFQKHNRTFKTEANGLSLKEILDQYLNINKLILGTVNELVGDPQKFRDPVEAFIYLLSGPKDEVLCNNVNAENQDSPISYISSSSDMFSDFSLNLNNCDEKPKRRRRVPKKKLSTVIELDNSVDKTALETTPESNELHSKICYGFTPRQSTRLELKKAGKNNRSCNSDSIKEMRKNPNDDCDTPCKVGKPPYSENKIQKPKKTISLLSSGSEYETVQEVELPALNDQSIISSSTAKKLNGLFSPEQSEKKTVKVLKPRKTLLPQPSGEQACDSEKVICKRSRTSVSLKSNAVNVENKKSKISDGISTPLKTAVNEVRAPRSSDELMPITNGLQTSEKPKSSRKSDLISTNDDATNSIELKETLPLIDGSVFKEKLINNKKLHEHMAASINEVIMNSPQKNLGDVIENLIDASMEKITNNEMYDRLVNDLIADFNFAEDLNAAQTSSDTDPQTESRKNETTTFNNQTQLSTNTPVDIEDHVPNTNHDVESHDSGRNAIVIEIREDQMANQELNAIERDDNESKISTVSEEFRQYFSTTPGIEASPKDKFNKMRNDNASVINVISPDGELLESCKILNDNSQRVVINSNSILYPINERLPLSLLTIAKSSEFQICGPPSTITQGSRNKCYVPIAPKPDMDQNSSGNAPVRNNVQKKRRTRGGKRQ